MRIALIHGGLYEGMTPERFWNAPGVTEGLRQLGHEVSAHTRLDRPLSWHEEAGHLARLLSSDTAVVAGSNGCVAAVRLALDFPQSVSRLVLCWPPEGGLEVPGPEVRALFEARKVPQEAWPALLGGESLRGCTDEELRGLRLPVGIIPSEPPNPYHPRSTVESLSRLIPGVVVGRGFTESPRPEFAHQKEAFVAEVDRLLRL